jgi:hypothetical protein
MIVKFLDDRPRKSPTQTAVAFIAIKDILVAYSFLLLSILFPSIPLSAPPFQGC